MNISLLSQAVGTSTDPLENAQEQIKEAETFFNQMINAFVGYLPTLIAAAIILVVGMVISKLVLKMMSRGMKHDVIDKTVSRFIYSLVRILLYALLATIVLAVLGVPMTSIIAVIGTAGVAIGLALQDSLSNIAGGFSIMLTKPFKIGDYIKVDDVEGTVEAINMWYTELHSYDNKAIFYPNGQITSKKVTNYTTLGIRRVDMVYTISYNTDFRKAMEVLKSITDAHELILKEPEPKIRITELAESAVRITCYPWVKAEDYWTVYFDLNEAVKEQFDRNGIEIPYNQLDVHLKKTIRMPLLKIKQAIMLSQSCRRLCELLYRTIYGKKNLFTNEKRSFLWIRYI